MMDDDDGKKKKKRKENKNFSGRFEKVNSPSPCSAPGCAFLSSFVFRFRGFKQLENVPWPTAVEVSTATCGVQRAMLPCQIAPSHTVNLRLKSRNFPFLAETWSCAVAEKECQSRANIPHSISSSDPRQFLELLYATNDVFKRCFLIYQKTASVWGSSDCFSVGSGHITHYENCVHRKCTSPASQFNYVTRSFNGPKFLMEICETEEEHCMKGKEIGTYLDKGSLIRAAKEPIMSVISIPEF